VLWTGVGSPPWGLVEYHLRKLYRCTPSELWRQDFHTMMDDLRLEQLEIKVQRGGQ